VLLIVVIRIALVLQVSVVYRVVQHVAQTLIVVQAIAKVKNVLALQQLDVVV